MLTIVAAGLAIGCIAGGIAYLYLMGARPKQKPTRYIVKMMLGDSVGYYAGTRERSSGMVAIIDGDINCAVIMSAREADMVAEHCESIKRYGERNAVFTKQPIDT